MDIAGFLKKVFPKPNIPQKRYMLVCGLVLYWVLKVYTVSTPDPADDKWPEMLKGAVIEMYSNSSDDGLKFGEGV